MRGELCERKRRERGQEALLLVFLLSRLEWCYSFSATSVQKQSEMNSSERLYRHTQMTQRSIYRHHALHRNTSKANLTHTRTARTQPTVPSPPLSPPRSIPTALYSLRCISLLPFLDSRLIHRDADRFACLLPRRLEHGQPAVAVLQHGLTQ